MTTETASQLGTAGLFNLSASMSGPVAEISQNQAEALGEIWAQRFAPGIRSLLDAQHGAAIDYSHLKQCGRSFYAESSFEQDASIAPAYQRALGSWWLVPFCDHGTMALSVAVSATATDLSIANGDIVFSNDSPLNDFFAVGTPADWQGPVGISPENAAVNIAKATGRLIASVPHLVAPSPRRGPPQAAAWVMTLDTAASIVTAARGPVSRATLGQGMMGFAARVVPGSTRGAPLLVASAVQPAVQRFGSQYDRVPQVIATVRPGVAVVFDTAISVRRN